MKTQPTDPPAAHLGALLREARPAPALPPRFQEGVWARIERDESARQATTLPGWVDRWVESFLRPRLALASLALLLAAGGLAGAAGAAGASRQAAQARYLASVAPDTVR